MTRPAIAARFSKKRSRARRSGPRLRGRWSVSDATDAHQRHLDARIDQRVGDVGEKVDEDDAGADHQSRAHDDGIVARADGIDEQEAHARPVEDAFEEDRAADRDADGRADQIPALASSARAALSDLVARYGNRSESIAAHDFRATSPNDMRSIGERFASRPRRGSRRTMTCANVDGSRQPISTLAICHLVMYGVHASLTERSCRSFFCHRSWGIWR